MAMGSGFRGLTRCPVWLLGHSEATIIPLGRSNQTNPIYSGKPGEASHRIIPNCRCEIVARGFVLGQMSGLTFLSAEVHWLDPLAGPHSWSMGWINIWQGTSGQSVLDIRGDPVLPSVACQRERPPRIRKRMPVWVMPDQLERPRMDMPAEASTAGAC